MTLQIGSLKCVSRKTINIISKLVLPVWILMCRNNWLGLQNFFEHCWQVWKNCLRGALAAAVSLRVCVNMCSLRWPCLLNALLHSYQSQQRLHKRTSRQHLSDTITALMHYNITEFKKCEMQRWKSCARLNSCSISLSTVGVVSSSQFNGDKMIHEEILSWVGLCDHDQLP